MYVKNQAGKSYDIVGLLDDITLYQDPEGSWMWHNWIVGLLNVGSWEVRIVEQQQSWMAGCFDRGQPRQLAGNVIAWCDG